MGDVAGRGFGELQSPEMWRGRQELHANALTAIARLAQEHNATFLLFLRRGILQYQHFAIVNLVFEQQQAAVGVNDDGFASLAEFLPVVVFAGSLYGHPPEDAGAAPGGGKRSFSHSLDFRVALGGRQSRDNLPVSDSQLHAGRPFLDLCLP